MRDFCQENYFWKSVPLRFPAVSVPQKRLGLAVYWPSAGTQSERSVKRQLTAGGAWECFDMPSSRVSTFRSAPAAYRVRQEQPSLSTVSVGMELPGRAFSLGDSRFQGSGVPVSSVQN